MSASQDARGFDTVAVEVENERGACNRGFFELIFDRANKVTNSFFTSNASCYSGKECQPTRNQRTSRPCHIQGSKCSPHKLGGQKPTNNTTTKLGKAVANNAVASRHVAVRIGGVGVLGNQRQHQRCRQRCRVFQVPRVPRYG